MAKKSVYVCVECGAQFTQWAGQCSSCRSWNTVQEQCAAITGKHARYEGYAGSSNATITALSDVAICEKTRIALECVEFDRVLGGGLVVGSVVMLGGDPGIGKTTLLLQALARLAQRPVDVLYVTGEESLQQIGLRAKQIKVPEQNMFLLAETEVSTIISKVQEKKPAVLVIDSIQTVYSSDLQSAPGCVAQVRESAMRIVQFAKSSGTTIFLIGHVTKEGALAGPRVLEHMVDTVLYFEGDTNSRFRMIRAVKNRFGPVGELGVFAMTEKGLLEVKNPSAIFLAREEQENPGSLVMVLWEGTRPLLVEIQALVDSSPLGNPRRVTVGLEHNRIAMLLAVLHRHGGLYMADQDVFVNVVGGVKVSETSADLAVLLAIVSSFKDFALPQDLVVFGEIGLAGEIRPVPGGQERLFEAVKHGFKRAIVPKANLPKRKIDGIEVIGVSKLTQALDVI